MANTILVLGFRSMDKAEIGTPLYFGKDADAANASLTGSEYYRHEFYQLAVPQRRKFIEANKNSAPKPAPEGEPVAGEEAESTEGSAPDKPKGKGRKGKQPPGTELL